MLTQHLLERFPDQKIVILSGYNLPVYRKEAKRISNLYCIKLALHGNDEVIPSTQTIDEALIAVGNMLENAVDKIETILNQEEGDDLQCQK